MKKSTQILDDTRTKQFKITSSLWVCGPVWASMSPAGYAAGTDAALAQVATSPVSSADELKILDAVEVPGLPTGDS